MSLLRLFQSNPLRLRPLQGVSIFFGICFLLLSCTVNVLDEFADKSTDEALYVEAQKFLNKREYGSALTAIDAMTESYQASREVILLRASANGGICGLNFLSFIQALENNSGNLVPFLLQTYQAADATAAAGCAEAQRLINSISSDSSLRTADENLLMVLINLTSIGAHMASSGVDDDTPGTVDASFDSCVDDANNLPEANARQIALSLVLAIQALAGQAAVSGSLVPSGFCSFGPPFSDFCSRTTTASFTADEILLIRSLVGDSGSIGVGSCTGTAPTPPCLCI